jgi:hypothetical protein
MSNYESYVKKKISVDVSRSVRDPAERSSKKIASGSQVAGMKRFVGKVSIHHEHVISTEATDKQVAAKDLPHS